MEFLLNLLSIFIISLLYFSNVQLEKENKKLKDKIIELDKYFKYK